MDIILGLLTVIAFIIGMVLINKTSDSEEVTKKDSRFVNGFLVALLVMGIFLFGTVYFYNVGKVSRMIAFQQANCQVYQYKVDRTENIIRDLRNEVIQYNKDLAYFKRMDNIPIVSIIYPGTEDLKYIVLDN